MTARRRGTWLLGVVALAAGVSMMVAAYGVAATRSHAAPQHAQKFGTLRAVLDTIDFLDPQQAYTGQSWWAMWNVYETLLTYKHVDGPAGYQLVPGLAQSLPKISSNGRVYKFTLRPGLKYSNGKKVLASDFKWAIKRGFLANGQGVGFYTDIAGAKAYSAHPTKGGNISGIITNNKKRTITIKLSTPRGDFLTILALIFAAPVPAQHVDVDPEREDPGHRAVPLLELRREPRVHDGAEQVLQADEVHPAREPGQDRRRPGRRREHGDPAGDQRTGRLLERGHPARPDRQRQEQGPAGATADGEHVLLLDEHSGGAVQQAGSAPGRQLRAQPRHDAEDRLGRARTGDPERAAADVPELPEAEDVLVQPRQGEVADHVRRREGREGHGLDA